MAQPGAEAVGHERGEVGEPIGTTSPLTKAIKRLRDHRLVQQVDSDTLGVVVEVPPLSSRALSKLPDSVRRAHNEFVQ